MPCDAAIELAGRLPPNAAPDTLVLKAAHAECGGKDAAASTADTVEDDASAALLASLAKCTRQRRKALLCFAAPYWLFLGLGSRNGSAGPLLPTVQKHYAVRR
ncbi:hypothetical protein PsYK624_169350 [Phanerochaete sordida]|uniref:Uncharacterized protein n=1 Tax=Phanerochaete sordida TaxID=48140 RepID=A0A9P3GRQ1_9APHY|nr:hypothetical protein PsYK624_169350 [Phanerochaete sordida]